MLCPSTGPKIFWAGPNLLCQTKNIVKSYCYGQRLFVPDSAGQKDDFRLVNSVFVAPYKYIQFNFWSGSKHFGISRRTSHLTRSIEWKKTENRF